MGSGANSLELWGKWILRPRIVKYLPRVPGANPGSGAIIFRGRPEMRGSPTLNSTKFKKDFLCRALSFGSLRRHQAKVGPRWLPDQLDHNSGVKIKVRLVNLGKYSVFAKFHDLAIM
jgi:hypothetical protein